MPNATRNQNINIKPIIFASEAKILRRRRIERELVQTFIRRFNLKQQAVWAAARSRAEDFLSFQSLWEAYSPKFPADIVFTKRKKAVYQKFTFSKLLTNPNSYPLFDEFISVSPNHDKTLLVARHPRAGFVAVTDWRFDDFAPGVYSTRLRSTEDECYVVSFGKLDNLLSSILVQGLWQPEQN
jgi:hypothetical protein